MGIESFGPARFQPYTITTGTGGAYATTDEDGNNLFGSGLNPALGGVSNQATEGAGLSQGAFQNALANNQGGFNSPQFQSQYQGLGGGNQNYPQAGNLGPDSFGVRTGGFKGAPTGGGFGTQPVTGVYGPGGYIAGTEPDPRFSGMPTRPQTGTMDSLMYTDPITGEQKTGSSTDIGYRNKLNDYFNENEGAQDYYNSRQPDFGGGKGPEQSILGGPPQLDPGFGYSEDAFQQAPQFQQPQSSGPQGNNFQSQPFDINAATDSYFQQGMDVLNPAFQQQNSNLAQSLQGSGRGGLQLASGGLGAGAGGMLNPDAYQTGNAQSNAMAQLYQQSRQSALGEQAQRYGQDLGTEQQRMSGLGQLFGQDLAAGGQQFNQNLQGFGANQGQLQNMSGINQQQMANLGLFAGMEGDLFNQGLAAEQVRSGANAGSMYQPQQGRESTASRLGGALVGGLAGNENLFSGAKDLWGSIFDTNTTSGSNYGAGPGYYGYY